jgi:mannosyltransferase OCH1-like enzyme
MYKILLIIILVLLLILLLTCNKKQEKFTLNYRRWNIPKIIHLTYKTKDIPPSVIKKFKDVYPNYEIKIYDNNDCIDFLSKEFSQEYVDIFNFIKDGPIKADFWRVCILYKYGGIYSDIDIIPNINVEEILLPDTTFLTCLSAFNNLINPHFIVSIPKHKVLKICIDKYLEFYRNKKKYSYWDWSIVFIMKEVLHSIFKKYLVNDDVYYDDDKNQYQFLKQKSNFKLLDLLSPLKLLDKIINTGRGMHCEYKGTIILYDKNENYSNHKF